MTLEKAVKILPTIKEYFMIHNIEKEELTLDGTFTIPQLEAIITIFRNKDKIYLLDE